MYLLSLADPDIQLGGTAPNIRPLPLSTCRHATVTCHSSNSSGDFSDCRVRLRHL